MAHIYEIYNMSNQYSRSPISSVGKRVCLVILRLEVRVPGTVTKLYFISLYFSIPSNKTAYILELLTFRNGTSGYHQVIDRDVILI